MAATARSGPAKRPPVAADVTGTGSIKGSGGGNVNTGWQNISIVTVLPPALVLGVVPPLIVYWTSREPVHRHPWISVLILIGWWVIVASATFAYAVVSPSVNRTAARLGHKLEFRLSGYGRRYILWAQHSSDSAQSRRSDPFGQFTPRLNEVYVELKVALRPPGQVGGGVLDDAVVEVTDLHPIWRFLDREGPEVIAVLGVPGGGKSTLLRHVAWILSRRYRQLKPFRRGRRIPVLLELRSHTETILGDEPPDLARLIASVTHPLDGVGDTSPWWRAKLDGGRCVVLLDGLDEVVDDGERSLVAAWIDRQTNRYGRCKFVITSRAHGFQHHPPRTDVVVRVGSFTDEQVRAFLDKWYEAAEANDPSVDRRVAAARGRKGADNLFNRISDTPALHDLTVNPLLLSMIAKVHRSGSPLPENRAALYAEVCRVILNPPADTDPLSSQVSADERERVLAHIAAVLMRAKTTIGDSAVVRGALVKAIKPHTGASGDEFLTYATRIGMLIEHAQAGQHSFTFAHLTFQEYLCARHIRRHPAQARLLADNVNEVWWNEVTLLWASGGDPELVVSACLDSGEVAALALAAACIDVGSGIQPSTRKRLTGIIDTAFTATADTRHRELVAGVLAMRHLQRSVSTSEGTRIATIPVTADLYWLYLQAEPDASKPDVPLQPGGDHAATGMWGSDAQRFVAWVAKLIGSTGESVYRLPTGGELTGRQGRLALGRSPGGAARGAVWSIDEAGRPALWRATGTPDPYAVTRRRLAAAVVHDVRFSATLVEMLSCATHARALLLVRLAEAIQQRAQRVSEITHRALTGGLRSAQNDLEFVRSADGGPATSQAVAHAQRNVGLWSRAAARAKDPHLDISAAIGRYYQPQHAVPRHPATDFECQEEIEPARARLIRRRLAEIAALAETIAGKFDLRSGTHLTPASPAAAMALLGRVNQIHQNLLGMAADLDPAKHREAAEAITNGWTRKNQSREAIRRAQQESGQVRDHLQEVLETVSVLPRKRWDSFVPSASALARMPMPEVDQPADRALFTVLQPYIGTALAEATVALETSRPVDEEIMATQFAHKLIARVPTPPGPLRSPDDIAVLLGRAAELGTRNAGWIATAIRRLHKKADPVLGRRKAMGSSDAQAIRIPALALAAEAVERAENEIAGGLYAVAAGATLLEGRAAGTLPAPEVILLAQA